LPEVRKKIGELSPGKRSYRTFGVLVRQLCGTEAYLESVGVSLEKPDGVQFDCVEGTAETLPARSSQPIEKAGQRCTIFDQVK